MRVLPQERDGGHHHTRGAEPALQPVLLVKGTLHRMHPTGFSGQALDRDDLAPVRLCGQHRARLHRLPVEQDRARTARRRVAADVGRGEPGDVTQVVHEQGAVLHLRGDLTAVHHHDDLHWPALASLIAGHTRCGVAGMGIWRTPKWATASITAFWTAGIEPIVPPSPMPLTPSGLTSLGVCISTRPKLGTSAPVIAAT